MGQRFIVVATKFVGRTDASVLSYQVHLAHAQFYAAPQAASAAGAKLKAGGRAVEGLLLRGDLVSNAERAGKERMRLATEHTAKVKTAAAAKVEADMKELVARMD